MHDASRARQHGEGDAAFTEEMEAAIQDLGPNSAAVAFIYLWCRAGRREADVTGLLDRVAGLMPESTWRGARKRLFDRGYLTAHRTPSGEFYTITAQPASCTRVAPDPQREFGFCRRARDPDGAQPASHPPSTVPLHGTRHAAEGEPAGPGARDLREIRADLAPPPNTKELARIPTKTKNQEPRIGIGGA